MKIKHKISFSFWITALMATAIVAPIVYTVTKDNLQNAIFEHLKTTSQSRARHIETFLEKDKRRIQLMAGSSLLEVILEMMADGGPHTELVREAIFELTEIHKAEPEAEEIFVLNPDGKIIAATNEGRIGLDRSSEAYFINGRHGTYITNVYYSELTKKNSYAVAAPIVSDIVKEFLGVLVAKFNLDGLSKITTDKTGLGRTGEIYLVNKAGYMITPSRFVDDAILKLKVDTENTRECFKNLEEHARQEYEQLPIVYKDYRGIRVLGIHSHLPEMQWVFIAEIDEEEAFAPLAKLKVLFVGMMFIMPLAAWLIGSLISRAIFAPIQRLREGTEIVGRGNLDYKVGTEAKDEIGQLSRAFDQMTENLKRITASHDELTSEVAERKRAEESLQASENKYRTLLENLPQRIFLKDRNSVYVSCNENYANDLGIEPDEIRGKTDYDFHPNELAEKYRADDKRIMEAGEPADIEEKYVQEGQELFVHTVKIPIKDEGGNVTGLLGIFWDVTEQRRAEEALRLSDEHLRRSNKELERSNRELRDITYVFSHDLQEPLRKIHTFSQLLVEDCGDDVSEKGCDYIRRMQKSIRRMSTLIRDLLAISRVGMQGAKKEPVEPGRIVKDVLDTLSVQVVETGAEVEVRALPTVMADTMQLEQLFQHLIENALKFRSPDRPLKITVSAESDGDFVTFCVADNGIGIEGRFLEKIFVIFQRLHTREQYGGTGVGLAICKKIVARHGGRIWVESEPGKGSAFRFTLRKAPEAVMAGQRV